MKTILCYGDSNTYGYRPQDKKRYEYQERWTGILNEKLKSKNYRIVEEGLVGRTTVFEDSVRYGRKGSDFLLPALESHSPIDTVVLMLGTNDCKSIYKASATVIGKGIEILLRQIRSFDKNIKILLVSPIYLGEEVWKAEYDPEFDKESVATSKKLKSVYRKLAEEYGCSFLAASDVASPSETDQEHLNREGHAALADAIYEKIVSAIA